MSQNTLLTTELISNETLDTFVTENPYLNTANRGLQGDFYLPGYRIGNSVNIRKPNQFLVGDGQVANPQAIQEQYETLTIQHQYHTLIQYTSQDLTLKMDQFKDRYIKPAVINIITQMERDLSQQAAEELYLFEGSTSSAIGSFSAVDLLGQKMLEMGVDLSTDAYCALSIRNSGQLKQSLQNNFNTTLNTDISLRSELGRLSYFDMFQTQNNVIQTAGSPGNGPITTSADVVSGNTIPMTGLSASTVVFNPGDVFSIAGVFSVNPNSRASTGQPMQFVVTDYVTSSGGGTANVPVQPAIISDISNPNRNISGIIPSGSTVTTVSSHRVNVAYIKRGLDIVCPPLDKLDVAYCSVMTDKDANVSIRLTRQGDIYNDVNALRLDVLAGFKWHPQYCVRAISSPSY